jgi:hypothetical protein
LLWNEQVDSARVGAMALFGQTMVHMAQPMHLYAGSVRWRMP